MEVASSLCYALCLGLCPPERPWYCLAHWPLSRVLAHLLQACRNRPHQLGLAGGWGQALLCFFLTVPPSPLCCFAHSPTEMLLQKYPLGNRSQTLCSQSPPGLLRAFSGDHPERLKTFGRYSSPAFLTFPKVPCLFPSPFLPSVLVAKPTKPVVLHFLLGAHWASGPRRRISLHVEDEGCNLSGFQL